LINPIVYAEIAFACDAIEAVDDLLPAHLYAYRPIPREAAFLAARAHADYRARGGSRQTVLADFLIGAHALVERVPSRNHRASRPPATASQLRRRSKLTSRPPWCTARASR
jgi:predicted nucleic acid-binding protein